jgi:RNA polymerase sigma factor (sigma-70 family)
MDDRRARFEAQVMPHLDAAHRFARWLARSGVEADDVVQEAFLRAFRAFDGLRSADARGWLLAIVRNCHATALERRRRGAGSLALSAAEEAAEPALETLASADPERISIERDEQRALRQLVRALAPEHREVLVLREMEDMSYREIATVTQLPIGTVMSRLARARAALRAQWLKDEPGVPRAVR